MNFTDGKSKLTIKLIEWDGDAYISTKIDSRGFSGQTEAHIISQDFKAFCKSLLELQLSLKGEVSLNSVSPNEIEIKIKPNDNLGHMSVSGSIGQHVFTSNESNWHSVQFGFEIEPQQLDKAIKIEWVNEYGT